MPVCGRASGWLSSLTATAGRPAAGSAVSMPVSGHVGVGAAVVVVDSPADVVGASVVVTPAATG